MSKGIRFLTLAVLVASLTIVGCSSDKLLTDEEYVSKTKAELTEFMSTAKTMTTLNIDDYRTVKAPVEESKRKLEKIDKELKGIQPPPKYVDEHKAVVYVVDKFIEADNHMLDYAKSGYGGDLQKATDAMKAGMGSMDDAPTFFTNNN